MLKALLELFLMKLPKLVCKNYNSIIYRNIYYKQEIFCTYFIEDNLSEILALTIYIKSELRTCGSVRTP